MLHAVLDGLDLVSQHVHAPRQAVTQAAVVEHDVGPRNQVLACTNDSHRGPRPTNQRVEWRTELALGDIITPGTIRRMPHGVCRNDQYVGAAIGERSRQRQTGRATAYYYDVVHRSDDVGEVRVIVVAQQAPHVLAWSQNLRE